MNIYEALLDKADSMGLKVKELPLVSSDGRICGNKIGIRKDIGTSKEKACVLVEELGHSETTVGDILNQSTAYNRKQERQARLWGYEHMIGLDGLIKAFEYGCRNKHDIAEFLEVTEEFLENAIECYTEKYGTYKQVGNYCIMFIPHLAIMKMI